MKKSIQTMLFALLAVGYGETYCAQAFSSRWGPPGGTRGASRSGIADDFAVAHDSIAIRTVSARLTHSGHGLEVRAPNRDGNIDRQLPGHLPAWYQTTQFQYVAGVAAVVIAFLLVFAVASYRLLLRKKKLERDRQGILEMVARRDRLDGILREIVWASAENQKGAIGAALQHGGEVQQFLAFSSPRTRLAYVAGSWTILNDGVQRSLSSSALTHGPTVKIHSSDQEVVGAMVAIFPLGTGKAMADIGVLEALSGIAGLAIENARLYDQLAYHARHDILTGLPNRWAGESELKTALNEARELSHSVALLFMDIDRFKHINDSLGHSAGDSLLRQIATRLTQSIPDGALAARTGGDEFTVLLKQRDKQEVELAALHVLTALRMPLTVEGNELYPSVSIGISMYPQDGGDALTLQKRADLSMYRAKSRGKNRYEFFSRDIGDVAAKTMAMEKVLRKALEEKWLGLHYQAQFNQAGDAVGMEALVRLHHPLFGLIGPADFIPIAEETGLIHELGEWVLREACSQIRRWQDAGFKPMKIAVNVSALQFRLPSFAPSVGQILKEMRIDPRLIEFELTESIIVDDYEESASHMVNLRDLGVSIAVDDFGTGYCALAHLHRLPIDVLKIDRSFVREIASRSSAWSLVQTIVAMARNLNLTVIAEGVETELQRSALDQIGCDMLQGFMLHRPQPATEIEERLLRQIAGRLTLPIAG